MKTILILAVTLTACSKPPTSSSVCEKLVAAGVGSNCRPDTPSGLGAIAKEKTDFDLAEPAGKMGAVYSFTDDASYTATVDAFQKAASLAGPHRYGNSKARIFIQMNEDASVDMGNKAKEIIEKL